MTRTRWTAGAVLAAGALMLACAPALAQRRAAQAGGQQMADRIAQGVIDRVERATDAHWHKGEYYHVINLYKVVVAAEPENQQAYSNAGWLLWSLGRDTQAIALYEQGVKANPNSFFLLDEIGMYWAGHKRDWARALPYYERAATMKDCQAPTIHMLAHAYEHTGRLDKAEATWMRALEMADNANRAAAQTNLARVRRLLREQPRR